MAVQTTRLGVMILALMLLNTPNAVASPVLPLLDNPPYATYVIDSAAISNLENLIASLSARRVIFIGEIHDRYEQHLNQLAIIQGLYRQDPHLAIGLEYFQQPFQAVLDRYVAGVIDEATLLRDSEYFTRWRFDYRLYRPLLQFAREHGLPLIALNVPRELTAKVARLGFQGLESEEQVQLPERGAVDAAYRTRLAAVFAQHPALPEQTFDTFLDAQILWDEGMAAQAADYLRTHAETRLVVLAGNGHLTYGQGIPRNLRHRMAVSSAVIIHPDAVNPDPALGDFLLFTPHQDLPPAGQLGVLLEADSQGLIVKGFIPGAPAEQIGLKNGDWLLSINAGVVSDYADVRLLLLDRHPGESVVIEVQRSGGLWKKRHWHYAVTLIDTAAP